MSSDNVDDDLNSRRMAKQLLAMELASHFHQQAIRLRAKSMHAKAIADMPEGAIDADELSEVVRMAGNYAASTITLGMDIYIDPTGESL